VDAAAEAAFVVAGRALPLIGPEALARPPAAGGDAR
jgi:hypothetical protein